MLPTNYQVLKLFLFYADNADVTKNSEIVETVALQICRHWDMAKIQLQGKQSL